MYQYPNICIVGPSGSGKSSSLRNLVPESVGLINVERKALPFKGANKFTKEKEIANFSEFFTAVDDFVKDTTTDIIVCDSFTSLDEKILAHCRVTFKGYDIYSTHNAMVRQVIDKTKLKDKIFVMIGIDEIIQVSQAAGGNISKRVLKVEGRELQGTIEKEFTCVFFSDAVKKPNNGGMEYKFMTNTDGVTTAKSPMGMFAGQFIDNDLKMIIETIKRYYE